MSQKKRSDALYALRDIDGYAKSYIRQYANIMIEILHENSELTFNHAEDIALKGRIRAYRDLLADLDRKLPDKPA